MCAQCMAAAAGAAAAATGGRAWLAARGPAWLTGRRLKGASAVLIAGALALAGTSSAL